MAIVAAGLSYGGYRFFEISTFSGFQMWGFSLFPNDAAAKLFLLKRDRAPHFKTENGARSENRFGQ